MEQFRINLECRFACARPGRIADFAHSGKQPCQPEIVEKGILEFMEYRAPAETALSLLDALAVFERIGDQSRVAEQK